MQIKVLGSGCSKCRSTIGIIERTAHDAGAEAEFFGYEKNAFTGARACTAATWSARTAARSSSARSENCRPACRPSSCARCRNAASSARARRR